MSRTLCLGDIHARIEALKEVLTKSKFDYDKDKLILLGDIGDGGYYTYDVIEELIKIKNIIFVKGNHDCIEENTEVLTEYGWQKINSWNGKTKISQYDINTGQITNALPLNYIKNKKKECIRIEGINTCQEVSFNHDVIINTNVDVRKIKAKYLLDKDLNVTQIPIFGKSKTKINLSDDFLRLYTWVIMDGCIYETTKNKVRIQFKLSYKYKITELKKLLDYMNIKYTFKKATKSGLNKLQPFLIRIYGQEARNIRNYLTNKKVIPIDWINMNNNQLSIFLDTLTKTDGHLTKYKSIEWISINKHNIDIIQAACCRNEQRTKIKNIHNNSGFKNGKPQYMLTIYLSKMTKYKISVKKIGEKNTYCFTMPKRTLITRCNGKIAITGNCWFINHIFKNTLPSEWINQGGANTLNSYGGKVIPGAYPEDEPVLVDVMGVRIPRTHIEFLNKTKLYHIENNMLFVHGGLDPNKPIQEQKEDTLLWDRSIIKYAETNNIQSYKKVFCGHTSTQLIEREFINYKCRNCKHEWEKKYEKKEDLTGNPICEECKSTNIFQSLGCTKPLKIGNLYCLDTGAGWDGKLTIMNIDNEEYWQSQLQTPSIL